MIAEASPAAGYKSSEALRHALTKRFESDTVRLPIMPKVAADLMRLTNDPNVGLSDLSDLIHKDASLAARIVQVANSAAYGRGERVSSLQEAVERLGLSCLSEIALSASLRAGVFRMPGFEKEISQLWRHSLFSAYLSKEIARVKGGAAEVLFLCGLLHTIGKPTVLQMIVDLAQQHHFQLQPEMIEALLEEFHWKITIGMSQQWDLPEAIQVSCAHYNTYPEAPACREEAAITHLADRFASWVTVPGAIDEPMLKQEPAFEFLHFAAEEVETVLELKEKVSVHVSAIET